MTGRDREPRRSTSRAEWGRSTSRDDRGQAYTLEGVTAAILLLTAVLLSLQTVSLTPTTPGTIDEDARGQLRTQTVDALTAAHENGSLTTAVLQWNVSESGFYDPYPGYNVTRTFGYGPRDPPNEFGRILNQTLTQQGYTYNVYVEYVEPATHDRKRIALLRRGEPTDNAVAASYVVSVYDDMRLTAPGATKELQDLSSNDFYAEDIDADGPLFNVFRVRVVVW